MFAASNVLFSYDYLNYSVVSAHTLTHPTLDLEPFASLERLSRGHEYHCIHEPFGSGVEEADNEYGDMQGSGQGNGEGRLWSQRFGSASGRAQQVPL